MGLWRFQVFYKISLLQLIKNLNFVGTFQCNVDSTILDTCMYLVTCIVSVSFFFLMDVHMEQCFLSMSLPFSLTCLNRFFRCSFCILIVLTKAKMGIPGISICASGNDSVGKLPWKEILIINSQLTLN